MRAFTGRSRQPSFKVLSLVDLQGWVLDSRRASKPALPNTERAHGGANPLCAPPAPHRKQNYNSGAIFVPGAKGKRTSLLAYTRVVAAWSQLDANISALRAAAAAAAAATAAAAPAGGAARGVPDAPLIDQFEWWLAAGGLTAQQERQARLLLHTRWQVGQGGCVGGWDLDGAGHKGCSCRPDAWRLAVAGRALGLVLQGAAADGTFVDRARLPSTPDL